MNEAGNLGSFHSNPVDDMTLPVRNQIQNGQFSDPEIRRRLRNIDTWSLMGVVLLGGIFILELLRFIMSFI